MRIAEWKGQFKDKTRGIADAPLKTLGPLARWETRPLKDWGHYVGDMVMKVA
ncbi:MAG: hypothetical protein ACXU9W_13905 [Thermodesulfobacteriota bacterium]